jgi:dipeptidyl aminopeptidase/acylaminoacyl peptidase
MTQNSIQQGLLLSVQRPYQAGVIDGLVENLKITRLGPEVIAIAVSGKATPSGELYKAPNDASQAGRSGREYSKLFVRYWDTYMTPECNSIFYTTLQNKSSKWTLSSNPLVNALKKTSLSCPVVREVETGADFDISSTGITFVAHKSELNPGIVLGTELWFIDLSTFEEDPAPAPELIETPGWNGHTTEPSFSPDGRSIVFCKTKSRETYYGMNQIFVIKSLKKSLEPTPLISSETPWDLSPETPKWSPDGKDLYVVAEQEGQMNLFKTSVTNTISSSAPPVRISGVHGSVSECFPYATDNGTCLLVTQSSFINSSFFTILDPQDPASQSALPAPSFGLKSSQVTSIRFKGAYPDKDIHAFVILPPAYDASTTKSSPVAFLLHGGPQAAWLNAWSARWNPLLFAQQGYVVVLPQFTGSTGYGEHFMNAIKLEYAGLPYQDIVACVDHIETTMPAVDMNRAVCLGGSFGGYMANWIMGQPLAKRFKCFVNHDGMLSLFNNYAADIMDISYDFGGEVWETREFYEKWDPSRFTQNWTQPMLLIHGEKDFRSPFLDSISAFTIMQKKGIESRLLVFPNENHWVLNAENLLQWMENIFGWINKFSNVEDGIVLAKACSEA